ncbi:MAG: sigma-70 family RNA polymerase sigma factor [Eubacteriales bacterium]|nr:sigma-70 family RNA polymerase sigma factor [Eubacteriales bacterium]
MYFRSSKKLSNEISLDEPMDQDSTGNSLSLIDVLSVQDHALEQIDLSDQSQLIFHALHVLNPREKEIIQLRYGLNGHIPLTQREVAKLHKISRSYVSRIEKKALLKLRAELEPQL